MPTASRSVACPNRPRATAVAPFALVLTAGLTLGVISGATVSATPVVPSVGAAAAGSTAVRAAAAPRSAAHFSSAAGERSGQSVSPLQIAQGISADDVWKAGVTGRGVEVAVIDTGVARVRGLDGPGKVVVGPDVTDPDARREPAGTDTYGHGTVTAGLIAGKDALPLGDTRSGSGIAPDARLLNVRVSGRDGSVDAADLFGAIGWVVEHAHDPGHNVRVLNLSFGVDATDTESRRALDRAAAAATSAGLLVVASAGNSGAGAKLDAPAEESTVLAVGASNGSTVSSVTSLGDSRRSVDVLAPGESVLGLRAAGSLLDTAHPQKTVPVRWLRGTGTSQATAVVSGAAALLLSARPALTPAQVKQLLVSTSRPVAGAGSAGVIDVAAALRAPAPRSATTPRTTSQEVAESGKSTTGGNGVNTVWRGSTWRGSTWRGSTWRGSTWRGSTWRGSTWRGSTWRGSTWRGSTWRGSTWRGSTWR